MNNQEYLMSVLETLKAVLRRLRYLIYTLILLVSYGFVLVTIWHVSWYPVVEKSRLECISCITDSLRTIDSLRYCLQKSVTENREDKERTKQIKDSISTLNQERAKIYRIQKDYSFLRDKIAYRIQTDHTELPIFGFKFGMVDMPIVLTIIIPALLVVIGLSLKHLRKVIKDVAFHLYEKKDIHEVRFASTGSAIFTQPITRCQWILYLLVLFSPFALISTFLVSDIIDLKYHYYTDLMMQSSLNPYLYLFIFRECLILTGSAITLSTSIWVVHRLRKVAFFFESIHSLRVKLEDALNVKSLASSFGIDDSHLNRPRGKIVQLLTRICNKIDL